MVVCKCRKATKLYCFVHKVPVCGECVCFPEHQICVVRTYSEWVIDGEYDWPPDCCLCKVSLEDGSDSKTTRLGCLHVIHTSCFISHVQSYPSQTAPAGYCCPSCSTPIWPPNSIKDTGSSLHTKLKEAILQSGLEKNIFGNHLVTLPTTEPRVPPPAFASDPISHLPASENGSANTNTIGDPTSAKEFSYPSSIAISSSTLPEPDIVEIEGPSSVGNQYVTDNDPNFLKSPSSSGPSATTRKAAQNVDRQNSEMSYYADDEDGNRKKYSRRGPFRHKLLRWLLPFWSSALPTLPVTAPPRRDASNADDLREGRTRRQKSSRMDPRKILLTMAIMACMATMGILYYRLAQRSLGENIPEDEPQ